MNVLETAIIRIIDQVDPLQLLGDVGMLEEDEYTPEAEALAELYLLKKSITTEEVITLFEKWFYPGCITGYSASRIATQINALSFG